MKKLLTNLITAATLISATAAAVSAEVLIPSNLGGFEYLTPYYYTDSLYLSDFLYAFADAKELRSKPEYEYVTYDAVISIAMGPDAEYPGDRYISLAYVNPNLGITVAEDDEPCIKFTYDVQARAFRLLAGGKAYSGNDSDLAEPVLAEWVDVTAAAYVKLGISVTEGKLRYFANDTMIFEYGDPAIGKSAASPFLLLNENNYLQIDELEVATSGHFFPEYPGDANNDGKVNLHDVAAILKHAADWKQDDFSKYGADANRDGKVNLRDAAWILQRIAAE